MARVCMLIVLAALLPVAASAGVPEVLAKIQTGQKPCEAALGLGSIWVANDADGTLVRIDPKRNRVVQRIRVARGICPVTVAGGKVWVASYRSGLVYRVDPRKGRVVSRSRVGRWPAHFAVRSGVVLVSVFELGLVIRLDAKTGRLNGAYSVGGNPSGLTVAAGNLWVALARSSSLARIDPASGAVKRLPLGHQGPGFLTAIGGHLWTSTGDGKVLRFDPSRGRVVATFSVAGTPADIGVSRAGLVWVADKERGTVTRIDPTVNRILDVVPAGRGAYSVVAAEGDIWVTSYAGSDVWRFRARE
jgi:virginiamycin B lyase